MPPSLAGPPLMMSHPLRKPLYIAAYRMSGFSQSTSMSRPPVSLLTNSVFFQVLPPSVVLKMPRSSLGPNGDPSAASHTVLVLNGWTLMPPICPDSLRPMNDHVLPASSDL